MVSSDQISPLEFYHTIVAVATRPPARENGSVVVVVGCRERSWEGWNDVDHHMQELVARVHRTSDRR
jgi:hypothetical protein